MGYSKIDRILEMYTKLISGYLVNKAAESVNFNVNERTIQRDIDDIRNYLGYSRESCGAVNSILYDRIEKGYRMEQVPQLKLTYEETYVVCRVITESELISPENKTQMIEKLISCCVPKTRQKQCREIIFEELLRKKDNTEKAQ